MKKHYKLRAIGFSLAMTLAGNQLIAAQSIALGKTPQHAEQATLTARKLKDVLNDLRTHYRVDILFSDQMVDMYNVPTNVVNLKVRIEKNLESILKPLGLEYKKAKDGSYLITRTPTERKRLSEGEPISQPSALSGMDSAQASAEAGSIQLTSQPADLTVKGKVTDEKGEGIPGVSVLLKGTTTGTATDANGSYALTLPDGNGTLLFSYIGYLTEEIAINNRSAIDASLAPDIKALSEVVVVGYGTQRKSDLTGAVSSISPKEMRDQPVARVDQALQGRSPGVMIQNNDASPNGSVTIRIRGANSINGNNDPLVVINGFIGGDLTSVNPNDIENIEVLKDASATAVYGSRGANGVILITTKKGTVGKTVVQYNTFLNFQSLRKKLDLLSAGDYAETVNANRKELGVAEVFSPTEIAGFKANGGTDWQDQIFRNALQQSHQLSISGGNDKVNYFLSGNFVDNVGIIKGTSFKRYSVRSNIESNLNAKVKVGLNLFLVKSEDHPTTLNAFAGSNSGSPVFSARLWAPTLAVYNADGTYTLPTSSNAGPRTLYNPLAMALEPIRDNRQNTTEFNTYVEYTILKGLTARIMGGARSIDDENSYYINNRPSGVGDAEAGITNKMFTSLQNTNQLTYQKTIANDHNLSITAVYEQQREEFNSNFAGSKGFLTDAVTYNNMGLGSFSQTPFTTKTTKTIQSLVGRVNYAYQSKYSASFTTRYDGASVFGNEHKWGFFPSVGLAWNINQEEFLKNSTQVSNLKLRASYGITGSQAINPYQSLDQLGTVIYAINGSTKSSGVTLGSLANPDLRWEKTAQANVGLDVGLFNDRVLFSADYYQKTTSDLLMLVPVPLTSGYETVLKNVGKVENKGIELSLGGTPLDGEFKWRSSANLAINRNKVLALSGEKEIALGDPGLPNFGNTVFLTVGQPMGVLKGYIQNGTWSTAEADEAIKYGAKPGYPKYVDQNNDSQIDDKDIAIMGSTFPKFTYGFTNTFSYKGVDLNVLIQGVASSKTYNLGRVYMDRFSGDADATSTAILDRWTPTNQDTDVPSFEGTSSGYEKVKSSRWLENSSYLRVKNITLGYNLPKSLLANMKLSAVRFYVSGVNLITVTKYTGYDPEARTNVDRLGGIDLASYPSQKAYTVGLNVTF